MKRGFKPGSPVVKDVIREVAALNWSFRQLTGRKNGPFKVDLRTLPKLFSHCPTREDFFLKMGYLASITKMDVKALRLAVKNYDPKWDGASLFEAFLRTHGIPSNPAVFQLWRSIGRFRDWKLPRNIPEDSAEVIDKFRELGLPYPARDFQVLWEAMLGMFLQSLREYASILTNLSEQKVKP